MVQCRVKPTAVAKKAAETLRAGETTVDPHFSNSMGLWYVSLWDYGTCH